ncbi:MAG: ATP-binding protein [Cyanobacteria bacterium P01_A01_bin.40]
MNNKELPAYSPHDDQGSTHQLVTVHQGSVFDDSGNTVSTADISRELLWEIYQRNAAAICVIEVTKEENYRYLTCNAVGEKWLGVAIADLPSKSLAEIFSPAEAKLIIQTYSQCVRSRSTISFEECILEPSGGSNWLTTLNPQLNSQGEVCRLISTSINLHQQLQFGASGGIPASREQLQQALKSKELVSTITKAIRDSLDEGQILQTATASLTEGLDIECCQIELYKYHHTTTEVAYEYPLPSDESVIQRQVADFSELYSHLLAKNPLHFVDCLPTIGYRYQQMARLACPIFDDSGILGNLWLLRPRDDLFKLWEIQLVQQIADQCAIAIRQARLYKAKQTQVKELEKLNLVKDDFLKTISHELRTPMSSIRLAISTLENLLDAEIGSAKSPVFDKVMHIFHASFKRQNQLVDDLLTLCYVDVASKPELWQAIDLSTWIAQIVKTYSIPNNQQQPQLKLAPDLPLLHTDPKMLQRVVKELLNNAYKYTPAEGSITIRTAQTSTRLLISISNSGIEIPLQEQERIFDKFYRIPNHDPWKRGGTGIGLALVKKLVELLEGEIIVSSQSQMTTFVVSFPLN